jgi:hypothetical protein
MRTAAVTLVLLAGCSEVVPSADAGRDSGRQWDAGADAQVGEDAALLVDSGLPVCLMCEDGGCVMRRQHYSEWTGLQCRDHSQAFFDADEAFFAAQYRLGCCIVGCCMEEPGCHEHPEAYATAASCAELEALLRN